MKKFIIFIVIFGFAFNMRSQSLKGISLSANYSPNMGENLELTITPLTYKKFLFNLRTASNFKNAISIKGGISYKLFDKSFISTIGVEYSYEKMYRTYPYTDFVSKNIEFPIQASVKIAKDLRLFGGIAPSIFCSGYSTGYFINTYRLGIQYRL